ncbi:MAG: TRAP transporter small permease [Chloroflexi bacterium]|nr:TRAP transporter small permease [Chloroflexota bacterium]
MMAGVVREAIGRYFFNSPTQWAIELSGYLMIALVFLGGASTYMLDGHVRVDMVYLRLGRPVRRVLDLFGYLVVLAYSLVLMWQSWNLAWGSFESGNTSADMEWPLFPFQVLVPLGCAFLALAVLIKIYRLFVPESRRGQYPQMTKSE